MDARRLGRDGPALSVIGLGCNNLGMKMLAHDGVASVIAGTTSPEQVAANAAAANWTLTADDLAAVGQALAGSDARA